jgi:hypothetical protein
MLSIYSNTTCNCVKIGIRGRTYQVSQLRAELRLFLQYIDYHMINYK